VEIKPLICLPSPRDIRDVKVAMSHILADQLWVKYMPEAQAYATMRSYFLDHSEYTHLVICPDDLVVSVKVHLMLMADLLGDRTIKVLSGVCNINEEPVYQGKLNIVTSHRINPIRADRTYDYVHETDCTPAAPVIPVLFAGFGYMWIAREIVERIPFRDDTEPNKCRGAGGAVDVMFCNDCYDSGITVWADTFARSSHISGANRTLKVGVEPPAVIFRPARTAPAQKPL
jgi:hypothetical protein